MTDEWTMNKLNCFGQRENWRVSRWHEEEIEIAKQMALNGATGLMIAQKLHRSRSAVMGRFQRLGIRLGDVNGYNLRCRPVRSVPSLKPKHPPILLFRRQKKKIKFESMKDVEVAAELDSNCKCTIDNLPDNGCRWPLWNDDSTEKFYCGAPTKVKSYCLGHALMATTESGYELYAKREPSVPLVTNTLPANSPKSTVA